MQEDIEEKEAQLERLPSVTRVGGRLALANEDKPAICYIHTAGVLTDEQRLILGEFVTDLGNSVGNVVMGTLNPAIIRYQIIKKCPFVLHMEKALHLKQPF